MLPMAVLERYCWPNAYLPGQRLMENNNWKFCYNKFVVLTKLGGENMHRVDVLNEKMMPTLIKLAWPAVLSMLFQNVYNIIDAFWLGKLGKEAIAAPTIAFPVIFLILSLGGGLAVAGLAMVSQHVGAGEMEKASKAAGQVLTITFSIAFVLGIAGGIFSDAILRLMGIPAEMVPMTAVYMKTIFYGTPMAFGLFAVNSLFTGWGDAMTPMILTGISITINAVLDPMMIFGIGLQRMEVFGAALATVLSRAIVVFYALYILFSGRKEFRIRFRNMIPDKKTTAKILKIGLPSSIGQSITAFAFLIITAMIARFGSVATAAVGVGNRITSMANMFSYGLSQATATMVGQYLGARRESDAYSVVWKSAALSMAVVGAVCTATFFFGKEVTAFFINEPDVLVEGARYFRIVSLSIPFFATFSVFDAALRGSGHTMRSMLLNIGRLWAIRLPMIYFFGASMGTIGIWYAMLVSNLGIAIVSGIVMLSKKWLIKVV